MTPDYNIPESNSNAYTSTNHSNNANNPNSDLPTEEGE